MPAARTAPPPAHPPPPPPPPPQQQHPAGSSSHAAGPSGSTSAQEKSAAETLAQRREQNKLAQRRFRERAREAKRGSRSQQGAGTAATGANKGPYAAPSPAAPLDSRTFNKWLGSLGVPATSVPPSFYVPPYLAPYDTPAYGAPAGLPAGYAAAPPADGAGKEWQDPEVGGELPATSQWNFANVPPSMSPGFYPFVAPDAARHAGPSSSAPLGAEGYASLLSQPFVQGAGALNGLTPADVSGLSHTFPVGVAEPLPHGNSAAYMQERGQPRGAFSADGSRAGTSDGSDAEGRGTRRSASRSVPLLRNDSDGSASTHLSVKREHSTDAASGYGSDALQGSSSRAVTHAQPALMADGYHPPLPQASRYIALVTWTTHLRNLSVDDYMRFLRTPLPTAPRALGLENHDVVRVLLMNAQAMGFVRDEFHEHDAISDIGDSFRRMLVSERRSASAARSLEVPPAGNEELVDAETRTAITRWRRIPKHMYPTKLQLTIPHHPWIDVGFPWPALRDRILTLTEERIIDEDELCADMIMPGSYDGQQPSFIVWGSDALDDRAWEMSEGFAQRWPMLIDEEMIKTTNFWRKQRGLEPLSLPERAPHGTSYIAEPRIAELDDDGSAAHLDFHARTRHSA